MSTNTIILIILGLVVLVVLILGFTMGWTKLAPFLSGNNVDTIVTACDASCSTVNNYDYCFAGRQLKSEDGKLKDVSCNYLAEKQVKYGVVKCAAISCGGVVLVEATSVAQLPEFCTGNEGKTVQTLIGDTLESYSCPSA